MTDYVVEMPFPPLIHHKQLSLMCVALPQLMGKGAANSCMAECSESATGTIAPSLHSYHAMLFNTRPMR